MELYTYFRSSAAYRVRIALHLKQVAFTPRYVHLRRGGGEQHLPAFRMLNPQGRLPVLVDRDAVLTQSLAIIEYLDETVPEPALLPADPVERALARSVALTIACDVHPLDNLAVLGYLRDPLGCDADQVTAWYRHWIVQGFNALEARLAPTSDGRVCVGSAVSVADVCLVPQMFNARRWGVDLDPFPTLVAIDAALRTLDAFARAAPDAQPDAVD